MVVGEYANWLLAPTETSQLAAKALGSTAKATAVAREVKRILKMKLRTRCKS